jgi:PhzF family phenazine biosynthesis protein
MKLATKPYFALVDAFADGPFSGNPAGVCITFESLPSEVMQRVAMEVNQAETAFLFPAEDQFWNLRWFTPACEVDLCGHATLAASVALWRLFPEAVPETVHFRTRSGLLTATRLAATDPSTTQRVELDFPVEIPVAAELPPFAIESLGLTSVPLGVYRNRMDYLLELQSLDELLQLKPDMRKLAEIDIRGFILTTAAKVPSPSGDFQSDFVSRFFAPRCGVDEDPATGSAHCALFPFWKSRLDSSVLVGYQASKRGGWIECQSGGNDRVKLRGKAYCTIEGSLQGIS